MAGRYVGIMSRYIMKVDKLTGYIHSYESDAIIGKLNSSEINVLQKLHDANGSTVEREVLLAAGWPGRVVGPNSLNMAINKIRKSIALAANDEEGVFLHTVPRLGFKLIPNIVYFCSHVSENKSPESPESVVHSDIGDIDILAIGDQIKGDSHAVKKTKMTWFIISVLSIISLSGYTALKIYTPDVDLHCHLENGRWMCGLDKNQCNQKKSHEEIGYLQGDVYVYGEHCTLEKSIKLNKKN